MRKMKESGIDWIGEIPEQWELIKSKNIFKNHKDIVGEQEEKYERLALTLNGVVKRDKQDTKGLQSESLSTYQILNKDELVFKMIDLANVNTSRVGYSTYTGIVSPVYIIFNNRKYSKFGYYFYYNMWQREIFNKLGNDGVRSALNASDMLNLPFPDIDENEANKIANFLDEKVMEIDKVIEKTKQTIEDYKKYKKSIITRAVTKGLNENIKIKDSGIEWIKKMPEKWQVYKTKEFFEFGKGLAITKADLIEDGEKVISYGQIHSKSNTGINVSEELYRYVSEKYINSNKQSIVKYNDFIFADTSEDLNGCGNCVYIDKNISIFAGYHTIILKPKTKDEMKYLAYLFLTDNWRNQIRSRVSGIKLFSITQKILKETTIIMPDPKERKDIVKYLDAKCSEIDKLIYNKEKIIEELENYKKSLIYEYVTGKKDVKTNYNSNTEMAELSLRIIEQLPNNYSMCKIKLNKIQSVILKMIKYKQEPDYEKYAAGPYSETMMNDVYQIFEKNKWVKISKDNIRDVYTLDDNYMQGIEEYNKHFKKYDNEITRIIKLFKNKDTQQSEIIATLFYCWNDFLIDGEVPTDEQIIKEFYAWSKRKTKININKVKSCLSYMKKNNLIPNGYGKKTIQRSNNYGRK